MHVHRSIQGQLALYIDNINQRKTILESLQEEEEYEEEYEEQDNCSLLKITPKEVKNQEREELNVEKVEDMAEVPINQVGCPTVTTTSSAIVLPKEVGIMS